MSEERTNEIIDACVPHGTAPKLARYLSCSAELVNSWRRRPVSDEEPYGTGFHNPLDRVEAIQDHAFAHAPAEAHRIHQYLSKRYDEHFSYRSKTPFTIEQRDKDLAEIHQEMSDAIQAILLRAPADRVRKEWEDVRREMEALVRTIEVQGSTFKVQGAEEEASRNGQPQRR
jgi:hypothetical protein